VTTITFEADGTGRCLYTEIVELQQIGTLSMERATTIEFNDSTQEWEVRETSGALLFHHPSRSACAVWEQEHFNQ